MTEAGPHCMHEACSCVAIEGDYCGAYCRESAGQGLVVCGCGHKDCAGTRESEEIA